MLPNARAANAVVDAISEFSGPVVFDPVLSASSGGALYDGDPGALLALATRVTVVTPNSGGGGGPHGRQRAIRPMTPPGQARCL